MSWYLTTAQRVHQPGRNRARARGTEQEQIGSQRRILPSDTGAAIACEGSSGRDWPGRNFFGAALCSAFSLERKARVGWWDVSLLVRWAIQPAPSGSRSLLDIFVSHGRPRANFLVFLPHSLTNTPLTPPTSLPYSPPPPHISATMVHTNGNVAKGETFLYVQHPANTTTTAVHRVIARRQVTDGITRPARRQGR